MGKRRAGRDRYGEEGMGMGPIVVHAVGAWGAEEQEAFVEYMDAHEALQGAQARLADAEVMRLSFVVSSPFAARDEKKRAMILLAHSCNPQATVELGRHAANVEASLLRFAALALDEAAQWSQGPGAIAAKPC